jgi:hypothetical protein
MARHAAVLYLIYSSAFRPLVGDDRQPVVREALVSFGQFS